MPAAYQFLNNNNCSQRIRWLKIYRFDNLKIDFHQIMQNAKQLESVETLILEGCIMLGDTISKMFNNLKTLSIDNLPVTDSDDTWLDQVFPKLRTFLLLRPKEQINLTNMLRNNLELNTIYTNNLTAIQSIFLSERKLSRVDCRFWNKMDLLAYLDAFGVHGNRMNEYIDIEFEFCISYLI